MSRRRWIFRGNPDRVNRECSWATTTRCWLSVRRCVRCSRGRSDHPRKLCSRAFLVARNSPRQPSCFIRARLLARSETTLRRGRRPQCSRDALTGRGKTFDGDGGSDDGHRENIHDPDDQEDGHQTDTALAAVEAEAQAVLPGGTVALARGCLPAAGEMTCLPGGELEEAGQ